MFEVSLINNAFYILKRKKPHPVNLQPLVSAFGPPLLSFQSSTFPVTTP